MIGRIRSALKNGGFSDVPESASVALSDHGMDSLLLATGVLELEEEFSIRIPADRIQPEAFATLTAIEALILSLGGK